MDEGKARSGHRTEYRRATRGRWFAKRSDRIPVLVVGLILAITPVLGATALAGSGGVGTGDGSGSRSSGSKYDRLWDGFSRKDKRWAHSTSQCESGQRPKIHGGGGTYHGAFQFMLATWRNAPRTPGGDPHTYDWKTQAVVAVFLKHRDGAGQWPNCG